MSAKQLHINHWEELQNIALKLNEGVVTTFYAKQPEVNAYGRRSQVSTQGDIGFNLGLAATGLRTIAFLKGKQLNNTVIEVEQAVKQQLATVLVVQYNSLSEVMQFNTTGAFILSASTWQEAADFMFIAHYVAEKSLIPAVVAISEFADNSPDSIQIDINQAKSYLGNPDEWIDAPTPSQKLIFGDKRKRIPNWFDPDLPITLGAIKNSKDDMFERAAHHTFFEGHLQELLKSGFTEFKDACGREYDSVEVAIDKKAAHAVMSTGLEKELINDACETVSSKHKHRFTNLVIHQLHPLPKQEIKQYLNDLKGITILDQSSERGFTKACQVLLYEEAIPIYSAAYAGKLKKNSLEIALEHMLSNGEKEYWLDVPVSKEKSRFPKHEVLINHINRAYPSLVNQNVVAKDATASEVVLNRKVPKKIRQFKDAGPAYTKVARFYDDTALLYNTDEMIADPFQAVAAVPSDTASFKDTERQFIPKFVQENCTGCGDCFVVCPHSALPPLAINVRNLIEGGMAISKQNGKVLKSFIPLTKAIVAECNDQIKANGDEITNVADFLSTAARKVFTQKGLVDEKLAEADGELETLLSLIGETPIAITEIFFTAQNIQDPNEGELFTLGLDTSACVGCGICASACEEEALEMVEQTPEMVVAAEESFSRFEALPDTDGYILERQIVDENYDPLTSVLLSRPFYQSVNGATSEHEPAPKVVLHLAAAMAELAIQPKVRKTISEIDELLTKLEEYIHKDLNEALPAKDYESLNEALKSSNGQRIPFDEMIASWGNQEHLKLIDAAELQLRMDLIHDLKEFKWALTDGPTGLGRSRYSLLIDASLKEMVPYPWSTFTTPVLVNWDASSTAMAEGLVQGCIRHTIDNIKILRRAQLVAQKNYNPAIHDKELAGLEWESLTKAERAIVMPIILVARKEAVDSNKKLLQLLHQPWPIKVVILDEAVSNPDTAVADLAYSQTQIVPLIAQQKAIILKSSLADKEHMYHGLHAGLNSDGAALFWLLAPRASAHSTPWQKWPKLNALAFNSRAFTHLYYNPSKKEKMLSTAIEIENNPLAKHNWKEIDFKFLDNNEENVVPYQLTWADWAYTQHNWRGDFKEIPNEAPTLTMAEFLLLDNKKRGGNTPVIYRQSAENELQKYAVSDRVVAATETVLTSWNVLQEIAGLKSAFPDKLRKEIEIEFTSLKNVEIAKIEKAHKAKIASLEGEYLEKMKDKISNNLMNLSKLLKD